MLSTVVNICKHRLPFRKPLVFWGAYIKKLSFTENTAVLVWEGFEVCFSQCCDFAWQKWCDIKTVHCAIRKWHNNLGYCSFKPAFWLITGAQPKAGAGHKMQSISVVFSTLHCEGYIADLRYRWLITLSAILKSTRHGGQSTERCIAFWGTTRSPALTMHKFMSENLRVNIWRDNFTSDYVRVNLPSRNLSRI